MPTVFPVTTLLIVSVVTNLTVEGIKKILDNVETKYSSNLLAVVVAVITAIAVCGIYLVMNDIAFTLKIGVEMGVLTYLSFLVATVGYDKVIQMFGQIKTNKTL